jgi:hypothetical protein
MGWTPKFTAVGEATMVDVAPTPELFKYSVVVALEPPVVVLAVTLPSLEPMRVGVKVTGTVTDCPGESTTGSEALGEPSAYEPPETPKLDTVVDAVGELFVKVADDALDCEMTVGAKLTLSTVTSVVGGTRP